MIVARGADAGHGLLVVLVLIGCVLAVGGCPAMAPPGGMTDDGMSDGDTGDEAPDDGPVSFTADVQPIFTTYCANCHREGGIADNAGIALRLVDGESRDDLINQSSVQDPTLTLVVPGDSSQSLLWQKISMDDPPVGSRMPFQQSPLDEADIDTIRRWIDEGAMAN